MKILAICRGAPGLGRVAPCVGLSETLRRSCGARTVFASYAAGYDYLARTGREAIDMGRPDGLFADSVSPQAIRALQLAESIEPDLILVDGEFYVLATLAHLPTTTAYVANPHDVVGPDNTFRRVNRLMLAYADAVIVSGLDQQAICPLAMPPSVPYLAVPPIIREFPVHRHTGSGQVLISMGGGSIGAGPTFRESTDLATAAVIGAVGNLIRSGTVSSATLVLGADGTVADDARAAWLTVQDHPVELTSLYASHDVLVTRAGRNATAEALYCGIPTVLLPVTADDLRGSEQASNAAIASAASNRVFAVGQWHRPDLLQTALARASDITIPATPALGRGNERAAEFLLSVAAGKRGLIGHHQLPAEGARQ
jgi:UDP:flavonoid glycosyltransferase YjiC (YdhE family)